MDIGLDKIGPKDTRYKRAWEVNHTDEANGLHDIAVTLGKLVEMLRREIECLFFFLFHGISYLISIDRNDGRRSIPYWFHSAGAPLMTAS